jgi:hypothetical protein
MKNAPARVHSLWFCVSKDEGRAVAEARLTVVRTGNLRAAVKNRSLEKVVKLHFWQTHAFLEPANTYAPPERNSAIFRKMFCPRNYRII